VVVALFEPFCAVVTAGSVVVSIWTWLVPIPFDES
jgi:hypothetical protein